MNAPLLLTFSGFCCFLYVADSQARRRKGAWDDDRVSFLGWPVVTPPHWQSVLVESHVAKHSTSFNAFIIFVYLKIKSKYWGLEVQNLKVQLAYLTRSRWSNFILGGEKSYFVEKTNWKSSVTRGNHEHNLFFSWKQRNLSHCQPNRGDGAHAVQHCKDLEWCCVLRFDSDPGFSEGQSCSLSAHKYIRQLSSWLPRRVTNQDAAR